MAGSSGGRAALGTIGWLIKHQAPKGRIAARVRGSHERAQPLQAVTAVAACMAIS